MSVLSRLFTKAPSPPESTAEANAQPEVAADAASTGPINVETLLSASALSVDASSVMNAIASIDDPATLRKLAIDGASTTIRQLAAHGIHDPAQLRDLLKHVRGKDKNVYKIIRNKCDALLAVDKAAAETQATIAAVCAALERHIHVPFDNLFAPALEHFVGQWSVVAMQAAPEMQDRANKAIDRCRAIVAERVREKDAQTARAAAIANADTDRQGVLAELRGFLEAQAINANGQTDQSTLQTLSARWSEIARCKPASADDQAMFAKLRKAIEELAVLIVQHGTIAQQAEYIRNSAPDDGIPQSKTLRRMLDATYLLDDVSSEALSDAKSALQAWEQARKDKYDADANALRQLGSLIRKTAGVLNAGNTRLAAGLRRAVEEKMQSVPEVPPHLAGQVQQLDEKLKLLQDWRSYAVAPKRIELIEHMEALIGMDENPQILAEQIKRLQDDWKAISKGTTDDTDAEWKRFHEAAQKAYEPCRELFAAQAKQREDNLNKRKALLDRLAKFMAAQDWQATDWREVARLCVSPSSNGATINL